MTKSSATARALALCAVLGAFLAAPARADEAAPNAAATDQQQRPYHAPTIARDPARPGWATISYHDDYGADGGCYLARSTDAGATWNDLHLVGAGGTFAFPDPYTRCLRPSIAYGPDGTLYYVYSVFRRVPNRRFGGYSTLFFTSSHDGGSTFTAPVRVDPNQPAPDVFASGVGDINARLAVDDNTGRVYVGWHRSSTDFYSNADGFVASSTDGGQSFSTPVKVDPDPQKANLVIPTVGPDGRLYVAYQDFEPSTAANGAGPNNLFVTSSNDAGAHFSTPVKVAAASFGSCDNYGCQQDAAGNYTRSPAHDIKAGRSPGQLFYTASWYRPEVGANRAQLWVSNDGGSSWSAPRSFGIPEGGASDGQLLPSLSVTRDSRLDIGYLDLQPDMSEDTYLTSSGDSGGTFSTPRRVSDVASNTRLGPAQDFGNDAYSEGTLVSSSTSDAYLGWVDSRRGGLDKLDIFSARVSFGPVPGTGGSAPGPASAGGALAAGTTPVQIAVARDLSISPSAFFAGASGPSARAGAAVRRRRTGARVRYRLSVAASVRFTVERRVTGRRVGGRCVAKRKSNSRRRACTSYVHVRGSFILKERAGRNSLRFMGRVHGKRLRPGRYRLVVTPSANGRTGTPARKAFRIRG